MVLGCLTFPREVVYPVAILVELWSSDLLMTFQSLRGRGGKVSVYPAMSVSAVVKYDFKQLLTGLESV